MSPRCLFLSYHRTPETTPAMERLYRRAKVQLGGAGLVPFFDKASIDAGDAWMPAIDDALARSAFFLALVSVDYWLSEQCRRELDIALDRYQRTQAPRLLFVLADRLDPSDLALDADAAAAHLQADPNAAPPLNKVKSLGQFNFLGPYDAAGRLVRLAFESPRLMDDQFAALIQQVQRLDAKAR